VSALTAAFVRTAPPGKHHDGRNGLFLEVTPTGSRQWKQRMAIENRRSDYGLGGLRHVSLAEAREQAARNVAAARAFRLARRRGEEPLLPGFERARRVTLAERKGLKLGAAKQGLEVPVAAARGRLTFAAAWEACAVERAQGWKDRETALRSWRADIRPANGTKRPGHLARLRRVPVADLTVDHLREVLARLAPATAEKVLRRTGTVLQWAKAGGHCTSNVARDLAESRRGLKGRKAEPRKALPYPELPAFYARLRAHATDGAAGALALVLLTALRSKEGRLARWEEMDLEARVWTVPGERMKDGQAFRVPLSDAATAVLEAAGPRREGLVFRAPRGGPVAQKALLEVMARLGADATVHGLRSSFRDWAGENPREGAQGIAREVAEGCLAHKVGSSVEQAYARSDLLERRRAVMQAWGEFLDGAA